MAISTNGTVLARVAGALYNTQMSNATYDEVSSIVTTSASLNALVNDLYSRDFASATDLSVATTLVSNLGLSSVAGLNAWVAAQLTAATAGKGAKIVELLNGFAQMSSDATYGAAATAFNAKVDASLTLSQTAGNTGGTFAAAATTVNNATFTLTTGLDTGSKFTGGAGDDTFSSLDTASTSTTLTTGDSLVGGAGSDTLLLVASGSTGTSTVTAATVSTSGIETLSIVNNDASLLSVGATLMSGLTNVKVTSGTAATEVTSIGGIANAELVATQYGLTLASTSTAAAGTADATTITLNGVGTTTNVSVTYDSVETANVVTTGVASGRTSASSGDRAVSIVGSEIDTVNISGSVTARLSVNLDGADAVAQVGVVNMSAASVGMTVAVTEGGSGYVSITGSAGNDVIIDSSTLDKYHTIAGGEGTDTLQISGTISYVTTDAVQTAANVTGFETLSLDGNTADLRSFTGNTFTAVTNASSTAASATKVGATLATANLTNTGGLTLTRATDGTADALAVNLTKSGGATVGVLTVEDEETITISSAGTGAAGNNVISALTVADATSLTVTGSRGLDITSLVGEVALKTVDASANTGSYFKINAADSNVAMTVTANAGAETTAGGTVNDITTGAGADTVTGGAYSDSLSTGSGADVVVGGAGNDTLTLGAGADNGTGGDGNDTISGEAGNDILDGGAGNDSLNGGAGDDSLTGGDGNDTITTGAGNDTVVGGAGNDTIYSSSVNADSNINGGTGTDTLATQSVGTVDASDFVVAELDTGTDEFVIVDVDTVYLQAELSSGNTTAATGETLDLTNTSGITTLNLDVEDGADTAALTVKNFGGTSVILTAFGDGTSDNVEDMTVDGTNQAALTITARNFNQSGATAETFTVTGVQAATITGTSYVSTTAQSNKLGAIAANDVSSLTLTTTGATIATNANALLALSVSADDAETLKFTVGANDTLTTGAVDTVNDLLQTATITVGANGTMTTPSLDFSTSSVDTLTINLSEDGTLSDGSTGVTEVTATTISAMTVTLAANADIEFDLNAAVTAGTITINSGATLTTNAFGVDGGGDSSITIDGRGGFVASQTLVLEGDDFTLNFSAVTGGYAVVIDASGLSGIATVTSGNTTTTITGGASNDVITGGNGADSIVGGDGNDTITLGAGNDTVSGGAGADTIDVGTGDNRINYVANDTGVLYATEAAKTALTALTTLAAGGTVYTKYLDKISSFAASDLLSLSSVNSDLTAGTNNTLADDKIIYVQGSYSASTHTFTQGTATSDTDTLVVYDEDSASTTDYVGIVLVGYASTSWTMDYLAATGILGVA